MSLLQRIGRERLVFGHRGVPDETPENTIASFQKAMELGLDGVELDARLCTTGELIVFHDDKVDKVTNGSGLIEELSFEELRALDAGSHLSEDFKDERIPTLEETLEVLGDKMLINIELKTKSIRDDGLEKAVIDLVERMGLQFSVILSSFNPFSVWRVTKINPALTTALLFAEDQPIYLKRAWGSYLVRIAGLHPRYPLVTDKLLKRARANRWFVCTWTVDETSAAEHFFEMGVDIVITNHPGSMKSALGT